MTINIKGLSCYTQWNILHIMLSVVLLIVLMASIVIMSVNMLEVRAPLVLFDCCKVVNLINSFLAVKFNSFKCFLVVKAVHLAVHLM